MMCHRYINANTHTGAQKPKTKHTHTCTYKLPVDHRHKHMGALKHAWQAKVCRGQRVIMRGGRDRDEMKAMVYGTIAI